MNEKLLVRQDGSVLYQYDVDRQGCVGFGVFTFNEIGAPYQNTFRRLLKCWEDQGYKLETRTTDEYPWVADFLIRTSIHREE
jgi:hypothetical protein